MSGKKSQRQQADEAWERAQQTTLNTPGQLDISGGIVGQSHVTPLPEIQELPDTCPACGEGHRGPLLWSHMLGGENVQCVRCGYVVKVPRDVWDNLRSAARIAFGSRAQPQPKKPKRQRGAG